MIKQTSGIMALVRNGSGSILRVWNGKHILDHTRLMSTPSGTRTKRLKREIPPLDVFILNNQVKNLYRTIIRTIRRLPQDDDFKSELVKYAKEEFTVNKNVTDKHNRRYLLSQGKKQFKEMTNSIGLSVPDHVIDDPNV